MTVHIQVRDLDELRRRFMDFSEQYPAMAEKAVYLTLRPILTESKRICPVDTGYLRGSGYVSDPVSMYGAVRATIGYSAEYAPHVHENLEARHKPPTQAKFLETPIARALPDLAENLVKMTDALLEASA